MRSILVSTSKDSIINVSADTQYVLDFSDYAGEFNLHLIFDKPDVSAQILGLYRLDQSKELVFSTTAEHIAVRTQCETKIKGVLADGSVSNYSGKIIIRPGANGTSSFLSDSVLNLGNNSKNHSEPILQIEADDVRASHGATTGRVDPEQLYYLATRGLSTKEGIEMLVGGFFSTEVDKIVDKTIAEELVSKLSLKNEH